MPDPSAGGGGGPFPDTPGGGGGLPDPNCGTSGGGGGGGIPSGGGGGGMPDPSGGGGNNKPDPPSPDPPSPSPTPDPSNSTKPDPPTPINPDDPNNSTKPNPPSPINPDDPNNSTKPNNNSNTSNNTSNETNSTNSSTNATKNPTFRYISQNDTRWANETIGSTNKTIGENGSMLTSMSMLLAGFNITINGDEANPHTLNQFLAQNNGYSSSGFIIWEIINPIGFKSQGPYLNSTDVINRINEGYYCIINVGVTPIDNWCLVVGTSEGGFATMNPIFQTEADYGFDKMKNAKCFLRVPN